MHMSWISGNLNELEDPITKVNSWYVCGCPIKQLAKSSYLVILYDYIAQATIYFIVLSKSSQASFPCDVTEKCHLAEMLKSLWWQKLKKVFFWLMLRCSTF